MRALVIIEGDNNKIKPASLSCLQAASQLTQQIDVVYIGSQEAVPDAACIEHINTIYAIQDEVNVRDLSEIILSLANEYQYILAAATSTGKQVLPRVAANLDVSQLSEVSAIIDHETFQRPIYAGNAIITVKSLDPIKVLTIRSTCFQFQLHKSNQAVVKAIHPTTQDQSIQRISRQASSTDQPSLTSARVIVSGGRGFNNPEQFKEILTPLAKKLNAAIGASRAAVDCGFISNDFQVGQTGKIVAPEVYLAIGISGAIQHLAGILDSNMIIAINKDPNANIHRFADYSLIGDLNDIVPELTSKIEIA